MKNPRTALGPDPFGRVDEVAVAAATLPRGSREWKIAAIARAADRLLATGDELDIFVGGALKGWLENGKHVGDLERHFFRVSGDRGSHDTPAQVLRRIRSSRR